MKKPNVLLIICDQLSQKAVGALGNTYVKTPNIDRIIAGAVSFTNSYTSCPLCVPARVSIWTGRLPHETGILTNIHNRTRSIPETMPTLGGLFASAGYENIHIGKRHDAGALREFTCQDGLLPVPGTKAWPAGFGATKLDRYTAAKCVEYLKKQHSKPFFLVADLANPHDICGWITQNKGAHDDIPVPCKLPPLPANFEFADINERPLPIRNLQYVHPSLACTLGWTEKNYQYYLAAYYHYINCVDREIGLIHKALLSSAEATNTLVVFVADHGDGMGAHRQVTKLVNFYEEAVRIPFVFSGPGITAKGMIDQPLVSLVDLLPTLCGYVGLKIPEGLPGKNLVPWLNRKTSKDKDGYVISEWSDNGTIVSPGRMLRTHRYKYTIYIEDHGEELFDLRHDPYEKLSLVKDIAYAKELKKHRQLLKEHLVKTNDTFLRLKSIS